MSEQNECTEVLSEETVTAEESCEVAETPVYDPVEVLRTELAELKALIMGREEASAPPVITDAFRRLYPAVSEAEIPDEVFLEAGKGMPLEAAYALYERRQAMRQKTADAVNRRNAAGGWGRAEVEDEGFLSPDEVREMSRDEVKKHYARIVESMKHWS